ncbi:hypothetical protein N2152v2_003490 [Parachlorella kessleri]
MKPTTAILASLVLFAACSPSYARPVSPGPGPTEALAALGKGNPKGGIDNWLLEGAHPFLTRIGNLYYMLTTRHYDIGIYKNESLNNMDSVIPYRAWCFDFLNVASKWDTFPDLPGWGQIMAPELHNVDGAWYVYFTGWTWYNESYPTSPPSSPPKLWVLKSTTTSPNGPYVLSNSLDITQGLHGTTFKWKGKNYFSWSEIQSTKSPDGSPVQCLKLAPMCNATAVGYPRVTISCPEYDWEMGGGKAINEGPAALMQTNRPNPDQLFIVYTAGNSYSQYAGMGMLQLKNQNLDILDPTSWKKEKKPVFKTDSSRLQFGPSNPSFTQAPNGRWFMAYQARNVSTTGGFRGDGTSFFKVWVKEFNWKAGIPNFEPAPEQTYFGYRHVFARDTDENGNQLICPNAPWNGQVATPVLDNKCE